MDNSGRLYSQVAAEAGVTADKAMVACYLLNLSRQGKSLDEAAMLMRQPRASARDYARDWGITFTDYSPAAAPLSLVWRKEKRGRWILDLDGALIAEAESDGGGGYRARLAGTDHWTQVGSGPAVVIRQLSIEIERRSLKIFGVDNVSISMCDADGECRHLAPKLPDDPARLARALVAA